MLRRLLALLLGLAVGLVVATAAYGAGSTSTTPPLEVIKYRGKVIQTTELYQFNWYYYSDTGEWVHTADRPPGAPPPVRHFPEAVPVQTHRRINLVINSSRKPSTVTIEHRGYSNFFAKHLYPIRNESGKITKWGAYFTIYHGKKVKPRTTNYRLNIRTAWPKHGYDSHGGEIVLAHLEVTNPDIK